MIHVAIVVLNWKQPKLTTDTINSILRISHRRFSYQILLVDNGSPDDSLVQFENTYGQNKRILLLKNKQNLGYVEGNNTGIRYALEHQFDFVLIINNDVQVKSDFLELLIKRVLAQPAVDILGPKIYFAPGYEYYRQRYSDRERGRVIWSMGGKFDWSNVIGSNIGIDEFDQGQYDHFDPSNLDFISGCCLLVRRGVFQKIGLFDPRYFLFLEDTDFCQRAKLAGFRLTVVPKSVIWHLNSQSTITGSFLHDYFLSRNRLLFGFRYSPIRTKLALVRESLRLLFDRQSSYWKRQGIIDFYFGRFGRGSWH